jgi:hypothetical protein
MTEQEAQPEELEDWQKWFFQFVEDFEKESDRAAVILTASVIENSLQDMLRAKLAPSASAQDPLFGGPMAPLGSFNAKIEAALRLGLVSDQFARDLHLIRKIRNDFAHNITGCNFEDTVTRSRVEELLRSWRRLQVEISREGLPPGTRGDFLYVTGWMLANIRSDLPHIEPIERARLELGYSAWDPSAPGRQPQSDKPPELPAPDQTSSEADPEV